MIKKHEIIKSYQVILYCDNCGEKMNFVKFNGEHDGLEYNCPKCNSKYFSKDLFPYTISEYKTEGEEI